MENSMEFSIKKLELQYDLAILSLSKYLDKTLILKDTKR